MYKIPFCDVTICDVTNIAIRRCGDAMRKITEKTFKIEMHRKKMRLDLDYFATKV